MLVFLLFLGEIHKYIIALNSSRQATASQDSQAVTLSFQKGTTSSGYKQPLTHFWGQTALFSQPVWAPRPETGMLPTGTETLPAEILGLF